MGAASRAGRTPAPDADAPAAVSIGVGQRCGRRTAVPACLRRPFATQDRARSSSAALHPNGTGRGLSLRARRRRVNAEGRDVTARRVELRTVVRWAAWLGAVLLATFG